MSKSKPTGLNDAIIVIVLNFIWALPYLIFRFILLGNPLRIGQVREVA